MPISRIYLKEVGPFDEVTIDLPPGTRADMADTYLLTGSNGSGKSTILYAIAGILTGAHTGLGSDQGAKRLRSERSMSIADFGTDYCRAIAWAFDGKSSNRNLLDLGVRQLRNFSGGNVVRYFDSGQHPLRDATQLAANFNFDVPIAARARFSWAAFAYAGMRSVSEAKVTAIQEPTDSPFSSCLSFVQTADSKRLAQWIANQDFKRLKAKERGDTEKATQFEQAIRDIERGVSQIIGDDFKFVMGVEDLNVRVSRNGTVIDLDLMPDGLKSIVSWIADLLMRLDRIPWVDDIPPLQRSFLLLLDEVDIHLHPAWQRKVLPIVQRMFPNAQIIASTHSPFVVASAEDAHIIALKVENGVSSLEGIYPSQIGVSYSAVLRSIFGIDSEFDIETEREFSDFHAAKTELLSGATDDCAKVQQLAARLASRSEEVEQLVAIELRQIERQLGKRGA
jgi:predicted ATP-binding protein involved in virulence